MPDGAVVLVDGLIASAAPEALVPHASRLRQIVLMHMPLGDRPSGPGLVGISARERAVLLGAFAVVTTSSETRRWVLDRYALRPGQVHVAEPGVDAADLAPGTAAGTNMLCVAAVTPNKGHDVLFEALAMVADLPWCCVCVGALHSHPPFVRRLHRQLRERAIGDRVRFAGPCASRELAVEYASADLLLLASRAETYGMVVTEALARGLPVIATAVGGLPEALGRGADGSRPGLLVPAGDPSAFASALRCWLTEVALRQRLRQAARERRATLKNWSVTSARVSDVLAEAAA
jgi:glycosyltransferase involved in cell wall biosynthesis